MRTLTSHPTLRGVPDEVCDHSDPDPSVERVPALPARRRNDYAKT